jgi:hypothetical protein
MGSDSSRDTEMPAAPEPIAIPYSRAKVGLLLLGTAVFVVAGIAFLAISVTLLQTPGNVADAAILVVMALVDLAFFGGGAPNVFALFFDRRPGLVFDRKGLTDRTTRVGVGFVPWSEVIGGRVIRVRSSRFLMVAVSDPQEYRQRGGWVRGFFSAANLRVYGTPISLSTGTLAMGFGEMVAAFHSFHAYYKRPVAHGPATAGPATSTTP